MTVPLLLSVENLKERLGFGDRPDVDAAIESALKLASITLESRLRTRFGRVDATDTFFVDHSLEYAASTGGRYDAPTRTFESGRVAQAHLQLSRGLVVSVTSARASQTKNGLADASERVDLLTVLEGSDSALLLNEALGELRIVDYSIQNLYVEIVYRSGLLIDDGCPAVYTSVPDWLEELAALEATISLNANPQVRRGELPADELRNLQSLRTVIAQDRVRYFPMAYKPRDSSSVVSVT